MTNDVQLDVWLSVSWRVSSCETAMWRFGSGVYISGTLFISFQVVVLKLLHSCSTQSLPSSGLTTHKTKRLMGAESKPWARQVSTCFAR